METVFIVFGLLILFQIKHFVADYPLQTRYMLGKFKEHGWIKPLAAHCGVHAGFTFAIAFAFVDFGLSLFVALLDFVIHFTMDRIKASPKLLGRFTAIDPKFWWALGFDQMIHHLTHYLIILVIICGLAV